jgi:aquaporin Z
MFSKRKIAALAAEFLGTGVLAFVVLAVSRSQIGIPYFVAIAAGMAVMLMGLGLGRDVQLNPALTLALWTARRNSALKTVLFVIVQLLGGMAAYALFKYFSRSPIQALPTTFDAHVLIAEAFGTFIFTFIAAGVAYQRQHWLVRVVTSGGGLTIGIMLASVAAAGFLNPAVALAANAWAWGTYVAGPVLGAIIGVNLFGLLFAGRQTLVTAKAGTTSTVASPVKDDTLVDTDADADEKPAKAVAATKANATAKAKSANKSGKKKK